MCNLADRIEEKGIAKGFEKGIESEKINSVVTLIQNSHLSFEEVIKLLNVPENLIDACKKRID